MGIRNLDRPATRLDRSLRSALLQFLRAIRTKSSVHSVTSPLRVKTRFTCTSSFGRSPLPPGRGLSPKYRSRWMRIMRAMPSPTPENSSSLAMNDLRIEVPPRLLKPVRHVPEVEGPSPAVDGSRHQESGQVPFTKRLARGSEAKVLCSRGIVRCDSQWSSIKGIIGCEGASLTRVASKEHAPVWSSMPGPPWSKSLVPLAYPNVEAKSTRYAAAAQSGTEEESNTTVPTERSRCPGSHISASDDLPDRLGPFDADELLVQPAVEVGEAVGVQAKLGEDRGVEVLDVEPVLDRP